MRSRRLSGGADYKKQRQPRSGPATRRTVMAALVGSGQEVGARALSHLLRRIAKTPAVDEPFSHIFLEEVIPPDLYELLLNSLPHPELYDTAAERHHGRG